jgi:hypothetical protein
MLLRTLVAFFVVALAATVSPAEERPVTAKVGDTVIVSMTGDVAKEYVRLNHRASIEAKEVNVETTAVIAQKLDDGRFRIEHFSQTQEKGKPPCLVSFSTIIDAAQIERVIGVEFIIDHGIDEVHGKNVEFVPEDTAVSSSPSEVVKVKFTEAVRINFRVSLSNVEGVTLRSWKLDEEVGN